MSIICPNLKNEEVAREFEELKNATSEAAAYHIWSLNNGNGIDKAPNGEPSKLFSDLLEHYNGDRVAAIQAKARTYSNSFRDWFGDWTNTIKPGNIIFGHPAIGKTYSLESGKYKDKLIDWDEEFNTKRDKWIEDHSNTVKGTPEYKKARNEYLIYPERHPDYVEFIKSEWERVKNKVKKEGKILFASPHNLLKMFPQDFNRIINLKDDDFIKRNIGRGGKEKESKLWKEGINETISNTTGIPVEYLNENQYFEDYLNEHLGISKVVDENGEPLVVYHGTNYTISDFNYKDDREFNPGFFFTSDKNYAESVAEAKSGNIIMPVFLKITNPIYTETDLVSKDIESIYIYEGKRNSDGIIGHDKYTGEFARSAGNEYLVTRPNQIKSIDNQGTFSTQDNNIYLADSNTENISQLESMQSYSNSKELLDNMDSEMATVLNDVANKINMQPVYIEYTDRPLNDIYPEATYWTPAIYDRATNKIVVNTTGDFSRYGSLENVLLHEIAHAITLDSLAADTEAANELRAIQKEYAATHEDHASKNVYEFAAELFSNPEVIHNMQDFPAPTGKKTILQKLMDWFKRLFGKNTTHENLINRIVENVIEYNAYQTLEHNESTDDYIPLALPAASKREEIAATKLMSTFDSIVKTLEIRTQSMQYNPIDDSFDRRETVRNTSVFNRLYNLSNTVKNITDPNSMLDVLNGSIEYMNSVIDSLAEAEKVLDNINEKIENAKAMGDEAATNKYRVALDNFGAEYLYPHEANLNNLYETVFSQEFNDAIYESLLGTNVFNDIRQTLNALRAEFSSIKMDSRDNIGWKYKNTVIRTLTNFLKGRWKKQMILV